MTALIVAPGVEMPISAVTETIAILGRRGSGKTHTGSVLAEQFLAAGQQVVIIDPLDVWHGLRSSADGKKEGYPIVVFGGTHGDLPLESDSGQRVAEAILETGVSAILSLRHLSKAAARRFVGEVCDALYELKGAPKYRTPLCLIVDEADAFVPQRPLPDGLKAYGAIDTIVRRGRSSGFGTVLISQRAAVIAKDVLTQTEVMICHQTTGPQDRKALEAWVEQNDDGNHKKEFLDSLASLNRGEAWFWSPAWLKIFKKAQVNPRKTFDSSNTPKVGETVIAPKSVAKVDLETLRGFLAVPEKLTKTKGDSAGAEVERLRAELEKAWEENSSLIAKVTELEAVIDAVRGAIGSDFHPTIEGKKPEVVEVAYPADSRPPVKSPAVGKTTGTVTFSGKGETRVLAALAQHHPNGCTRAQLTILTGYKRSSRDTYLQRLKSSGMVYREGERLIATGPGLKAVAGVERLPTGRALLQHWITNLPAGEARMLDVLSERKSGFTRDELSERTGYKRSSRDTYLQRLSARELIVVSGRTVELAETLRGPR